MHVKITSRGSGVCMSLSVAVLLSPVGSCAFIVPNEDEEEFRKLAGENGLYPARITRVRGTESSPIKRSLLQFDRNEQVVVEQELVIELSRHVYTKEYIDLVRDFYLKM